MNTLNTRLLVTLLTPLIGGFSCPSNAIETSEALAQTFMVVDFLQTRDIHNHSNIKEANPILGPHPSFRTINTYFIGTMMVVHFLPVKYQWGVVGMEFAVINHNRIIGLNARF